MRWRSEAARCLLLAVCGAMPAQASDANPPLRVLFVGNSHTYTNDLPRTVAALARQRGIELAVQMHAEPGHSLADHLARGRLRNLLRHDWDWVLLQQGTSAHPASRADLIDSTRRIAALLQDRPVVRIGLVSIWPMRQNAGDFAAAEESYRRAAEAIRACVLPAASAWRIALNGSNAPRLYQPDGLHATRAGTVLMALTLLPGLIGVEQSGLESMATHPSPDTSIEIQRLQSAAWSAHRDEPRNCSTQTTPNMTGEENS